MCWPGLVDLVNFILLILIDLRVVSELMVVLMIFEMLHVVVLNRITVIFFYERTEGIRLGIL